MAKPFSITGAREEVEMTRLRREDVGVEEDDDAGGRRFHTGRQRECFVLASFGGDDLRAGFGSDAGGLVGGVIVDDHDAHRFRGARGTDDVRDRRFLVVRRNHDVESHRPAPRR